MNTPNKQVKKNKKNLVRITGVLACLASLAGFSAIAQSCTPAPANLVSWWSAEGDATDQVGGNAGTLVGGITFGPGEVGQGFVVDGNQGSGVQLGTCPNLQLQNFTVEAWVRRSDLSVCSLASGGSGELFCYGVNGYSMFLDPGGHPSLGKTAVSSVISTGSGISDFNFHHVAITKTNSTVMFYVDAVAAPPATYSEVFTFTSSAGLGTQGDNLNNAFLGTIDELSVYSRALSSAEIQNIFQAGQAGKCASNGPVITAQPTNQTVNPGSDVVFSVAVTGTPPFHYQWVVNGNNISGATNFFVTAANVQEFNSGDSYDVMITNASGSIMSSVAILTVIPPPPCVTPTSGLISWWKAEGNALDQISTNNGTLAGNSVFGSGEVGKAFVFDGNQGGGVQLGACSNLQLQNFTVEAWVQRSSLSVCSLASGGNGDLFCFGVGGYSVFLDHAGHPCLGQTAVNAVISTGNGISDLNFHHVAVTKSGSAVTFYVDGNAAPSATYSNTFVFNTPAALGSQGDNLNNAFLGRIDELAVYSNVLAASDIQAIYNAGAGGKCQPPAPPFFVSQPSGSQVLYAGSAVTYTALVGGATPLQYQWQLNGTNLASQTSLTLNLTNLQTTNSGLYQLVVGNVYGIRTNPGVTLTVLPIPPCITPPFGLVSWWPGEGNALDRIGGNNGTLISSPGFIPGEVGQAFNFNGTGQAVKVGNPTNLQLQNLTIEAWIKRASTNIVSHGTGGNAFLFAYGNGGYGFGIDVSNRMMLSQVGGGSLILSNVFIADTNFHHVAVTKSGSNVFFYLDGAAYSNGTFGPTFTFTTSAAIGARGDTFDNSFLGTIDEASIYGRVLSTGEIQSIYNAAIIGKCNVPVAPFLIEPPQSLTVFPNTNVTFLTVAAGSVPLGYQWRMNNTNLVGATNNSLTLTNVQFNNAGTYSLLISNAGGTLIISNVILKVEIVTTFGNGQPLTNSNYSFSNAVAITMQSFYTNGDIFYTLDGSSPTASSTLYTGLFNITQSSILQTLGYSPDFSQSVISDPISIFIVPFYTLTATDAGGGKIAISPTNSSYPLGSTVSLTAIPSNGWTFLQWQGDAAGTTTSNTVAMTRNKSVQAIFGTSVSNTTAGGGSVVFNPAGRLYPYGTLLQASAIPQAGNVFVVWGNAATGSTNPLSFLVTNANPIISALFTSLGSGQAALTVVPVGHGTVSANPRANGYSLNTQVTITATPSAGKNFIGWSGDASGTNNPLTVSMTASKTIFANFSTNNSLTGQFGPGGIADGFTVDLNGEFGLHYRLDGSSNLVDWVPLFTETNMVGTIHFIDSSATNSSQHFYRSVILP